MNTVFREIRLLILIVPVSMLMLAACSTYRPAGSQYSYTGDGQALVNNSMAVLAVVGTDRPLREFRRKILANSLEARVREHQPGMAVLSYNRLQMALQEQGVHQLLLNRYRLNTELTREDLRLVRNSGIKVRYLLVARIENDKTSKTEAYSIVRNNRGEILTDRQRITLSHQRKVRVTAMTYDMTSGNVIWSGGFSSEPDNRQDYINYTGSSFTGSVATLFTNSFANGRISRKYPPAPTTAEAISEAFKRIAENMRGNS